MKNSRDRVYFLNRSVTMVSLAVVGGCGVFDSGEEKARVLSLEPDKPAIVSYTGTVRGAYLMPADKRISFCAEPPPDVAFDSLRELSAALSAELAEKGKASAETSAKAQNTVTELAGRSGTLLLTRELLYRLCEANATGMLANPDTGAMFTKIVEITYQISIADTYRQQALLLDRIERAKVLEQADSVRVEAIVGCAVKPDASIDPGVLDALIAKSPAAGPFAAALRTKSTKTDLSTYLDAFVTDAAKAELSEATKSTACVGQR